MYFFFFLNNNYSLQASTKHRRTATGPILFSDALNRQVTLLKRESTFRRVHKNSGFHNVFRVFFFLITKIKFKKKTSLLPPAR